MSGIQNKNLLFYSLHPNDALSKQCLEHLDKFPVLNKQFIRICIHDPRDFNRPPQNIRLPRVVEQCKQRGLIPILAIAGLTEPVFAQAAISWMKESSLNSKADLMASNIHGSGIADSCCTIEQASQSGNSLFDTDYNIGFSNGRGEFNKGYSSIEESCDNRIVTYDDGNDKRSASSEIAKRMEQLKFSREQDMPGQRVPQISQMPQMAGGGGGGMMGMPQMPQMPQMPGGGMMGIPQMPQMPQMPGGGRNNNW
jgi:hypothetical protein